MRFGAQYGGATTCSYYQTTFSLTENPLGEGGRWISRDANRTRIQTTGGNAFGTQAGTGAFDDSYAYLSGVWRPDTEIITTLFKTGSPFGSIEQEHLHRCSDTTSTCVGYEVFTNHDGGWLDFVRWTGPSDELSDFVYLVPAGTYSVSGGISNGYKFRSTCTTGVNGRAELNAYIDRNDSNGWILINGSVVVDSAGAGGSAVLPSGSPGIGAYRGSSSGDNTTFGASDYQVTQL